ncbi:signal recognition particle-docking protein FtsY [Acidithiobacillus sp. M4-SHS-6]|uniref:signal recognition particle-docking protein FtsY n=1 Tax=Acidithiobacillus sp. M4-SHS-6 TaxID=3383024 RepID=UPI0039BE32D4
MVFNWFKRNKSPAPEERGEASETAPVPQELEALSRNSIPEAVEPTEKSATAEDVAASPSGLLPEPAAEAIPEAAAEDALSQPQPAAASAPTKSMFARLREGLSRSREQFTEGVSRLVLGKKVIDEDLLEDLEALLLQADLGSAATQEIMSAVTESVRRKELTDPAALKKALRNALLDILRPRAETWVPEKGRTQVLMMVGINGAGKTTTTGKLAARWKAEGFSLMLAAGDTFRAAAVEQLQGWGQRVQVPVVAQGTGADSASVIFDAFTAARARGADLLIADTAGRLHTQNHLMEELKKVKRVLGKQDPDAPHQVWLVLDAGTGQNALNQAQQFHQAIGLTGICITKLDGTAKGGVVAAIAKTLPIPIRYIGMGEQVADLRPFDPESFVDALFAETKS